MATNCCNRSAWRSYDGLCPTERCSPALAGEKRLLPPSCVLRLLWISLFLCPNLWWRIRALAATSSARLYSTEVLCSRISKVANSAVSSSSNGCSSGNLSSAPEEMSRQSSSVISTCRPLQTNWQHRAPLGNAARRKSLGWALANATTSSQLTGLAKGCGEFVLMGPSKKRSMPFRRRGPVSFAPRVAARLS